jgi:hypothetical protein
MYGDTLFFKNPGVSETTITIVPFSVHITGAVGLLPGSAVTASGQPSATLTVLLGGFTGAGEFLPISSANISPGVISKTWLADQVIDVLHPNFFMGLFRFVDPGLLFHFSCN